MWLTFCYASCLQGRLEAEKIECAMLSFGWCREHREGRRPAEANGVAGQRGEVGEQRPEAVDGEAVVGLLGLGLALGGLGRLRLGNQRRT